MQSEQLETEPQAANGSTETSKKSSSKSSLKSKSSKTSLKSISGSTVSVKNETTLEVSINKVKFTNHTVLYNY